MARRELPPLNALKAFEVAARLGGFRAAAEELNVTHSVIGRHVRGLELRLGVTLFERRKRGVQLTKAGEVYLAEISEALDTIGNATQDLKRQFGSNQIRILTVAGFGSRWLSRNMHRLTDSFPRHSLVIEPAVDFSEVLAGTADFGIGYGEEEVMVGDLELLASPDVYPVCSPRYAAENGPFRKPEDFLAARLLNEDFGEWWEEWFYYNGIDVQQHARLVFLNSTQAIDAALGDQGIALANDFLVHEDLMAGRLIRLPSVAIRDESYWLVWRDRKQRQSDAAQIAEWIKAEVANSATAFAARRQADHELGRTT